MSRCRACDKIMTPQEMFTREIPVDEGTIEVIEDMCTKCRKIILDEYEEDLSDMALDYTGDNDHYDDYYE